MSNHIVFRTEPIPEDIENIRRIVVSTSFFQDHEIPVAVELVEERLAKGLESGYLFIFAEIDGETIAYACFGEIACTKGSYDFYWMATHIDYQRKGIGKQLMDGVQEQVKNLGGRVIYIETSSKEQYVPTRKLYENYGYKLEAVFKDFYDIGDDKCVYSYKLDK
ncbi:MAG: GNAT family N-acetyltransferase [Bacteroidales bacterium]|jgi:ribosomal protein S18 acetylase RimI-like enzyme|nr:GNAT family N-acetyltransferase [Bacteroidales bacterium]MDY0197068.1 GNAT family N-acetyltransferase [Tenuifilaceae bacterium]